MKLISVLNSETLRLLIITVKASMVYLIKLNQQKTEQWNRQIGALKSIPNLAMMNSTQAAELATELTSSIIYLNLFRK